MGHHHHGVLSLSARTLKVFDLSVSLSYSDRLALTWFGEELGTMVGRCMLEAFSFKVYVYGDVTEDLVGSILRQVEEVLVKPGWSASALRDRFPLCGSPSPASGIQCKVVRGATISTR